MWESPLSDTDVLRLAAGKPHFSEADVQSGCAGDLHFQVIGEHGDVLHELLDKDAPLGRGWGQPVAGVTEGQTER